MAKKKKLAAELARQAAQRKIQRETINENNLERFKAENRRTTLQQ